MRVTLLSLLPSSLPGCWDDAVTGYLTPAPPANRTHSTADSAISREFLGLPPLTRQEAELGAQPRLASMPEKEKKVEGGGSGGLPPHPPAPSSTPSPCLNTMKNPPETPPWSSREAKFARGTCPLRGGRGGGSCQSPDEARTNRTPEPAAWVGASLPAPRRGRRSRAAAPARARPAAPRAGLGSDLGHR